MSELETCLAVLFKRKGKNVLTEREFLFAASLDYRWFTPKEAQSLLDISLKRGLLVRVDDYIKPTFDHKDIDAPLSFKPSKDVLLEEKEEPSVFTQLLQLIVEKGNMKRRDAVARINKVQEKLGIDVEVAALMVAKELSIDTIPFNDMVKKEVLGH